MSQYFYCTYIVCSEFKSIFKRHIHMVHWCWNLLPSSFLQCPGKIYMQWRPKGQRLELGYQH